MKKALGLAALAGTIGCADFHTQLPVSWYILDSGKSVEIQDMGNDVVLKYTAPASGDGAKDDIITLSCYQPFCQADRIESRIGGSGRFYAFDMLFEYTVENDNDGDPSNNHLGFSASSW